MAGTVAVFNHAGRFMGKTRNRIKNGLHKTRYKGGKNMKLMTRCLSVHISQHQQSADCEDELFRIKYFQKVSGHVIFKRPDLVDKMNEILARYYPSALPSRS
ncbi:DUF4942 domain-containing protein [Enterobacter roggenkampii]|nr:DUF4942 domain-containing protein [Enterobacteriaceae bacterium]MBW9467994.1 DUF4942 domain-containing protein [Enterobacter roggenkampii]RAY75444.1 DUF4942 domain-containing protein [Enterobacter roggenkampii]HAT7705159.1 DUF4942 domain-containing protein [Enterobacter roggenkampii]